MWIPGGVGGCVQTKTLSVGGVWTISVTTHSEYRFALLIVKNYHWCKSRGYAGF